MQSIPFGSSFENTKQLNAALKSSPQGPWAIPPRQGQSQLISPVSSLNAPCCDASSSRSAGEPENSGSVGASCMMWSDGVALAADSRTDVCLCFDRSRCAMESRLRVEACSRSSAVGSIGSVRAVRTWISGHHAALSRQGRPVSQGDVVKHVWRLTKGRLVCKDRARVVKVNSYNR